MYHISIHEALLSHAGGLKKISTYSGEIKVQERDRDMKPMVEKFGHLA